ncbi:hypothetical protein BaRGS_00008718, partial [Batillaria attramentaria]
KHPDQASDYQDSSPQRRGCLLNLLGRGREGTTRKHSSCFRKHPDQFSDCSDSSPKRR